MSARPERPFEEVRALLIERARARRNPFEGTDPATAARILRGLRSTAHEEWVGAFGAAARECARDLDAYACWRVARYPAPTSALKRDAYRRSQEHYLRAMRDADPPLESVEIAFRGRPGERTVIAAHLRVPAAARPPLVVMWGGIDSYKEERRPEPYLAAGIATLGIDMPGVADAPIAGSTDAERMWDAVFDWARAQARIDGERVAVIGNSTGGYWAAKLSRTHRTRIRAAVTNGGPVHEAFTADWIARAQVGEYPFELAETLAAAFGGATYDDWVRMAPGLSLVRQGVLDLPSAPLLVVHGEEDTVFPAADARLLIERGADAHIVPGGHLGGDTTSAIVRWLVQRLTSRRR